MLIDKSQEFSIQVIENDDDRLISTGTFQMLEKFRGQEIYDKSAKQLDSKRQLYGHGLGLCKKALNLAIANGSDNEDFKRSFARFY